MGETEGTNEVVGNEFKGINENEGELNSNSGLTFRTPSTNLPEKTGVWTKIKNALFCEVKVELTPY